MGLCVLCNSASQGVDMAFLKHVDQRAPTEMFRDRGLCPQSDGSWPKSGIDRLQPLQESTLEDDPLLRLLTNLKRHTAPTQLEPGWVTW